MSADRIVACACHEAGLPILEGVLAAGIRIAHFVTLTPDQARQHRISGYHDFRPLAAEHEIPVYIPRSYALADPADQAFFVDGRFDLLVQAGWQRLFPASILATLRVGAIGGHGSSDLLPKGRGRSPLNWSLIEGRRRFIMQLFLMTAGADDGPVFDMQAFDITPFDDIRTLYYKNSIVTRNMLVRSIPGLLAGSLKARPQRGKPSHYPKRGEDDSWIDWEDMDVHAIHDFVRAQTRPYPGAIARLNGKSIKIWRAQVFDTRISYPDAGYGDIVERFGEELVVNCRGGLLLIREHEAYAAP